MDVRKNITFACHISRVGDFCRVTPAPQGEQGQILVEHPGGTLQILWSPWYCHLTLELRAANIRGASRSHVALLGKSRIFACPIPVWNFILGHAPFKEQWVARGS